MNFEKIIPNASMRLAGAAFISSSNRRITSKIGAVMETDQSELILWLHAYPLMGHNVQLSFIREQGKGTSDVSVIIDHNTLKSEFSIGEAEFSGKNATVRLFSVPVFQATLKLASPTTPVPRIDAGSLTLHNAGHLALVSAQYTARSPELGCHYFVESIRALRSLRALDAHLSHTKRNSSDLPIRHPSPSD